MVSEALPYQITPSLFLLRVCHYCTDLVDNIWIGKLNKKKISILNQNSTPGGTYRRSISYRITLPCKNLPQNTTHDLAATRLGQIRDNVNGLGCCERADALPHLQDELLTKSIISLAAVFDCHESVDGLARKLVSNTNDSGLGDRMVLDQSSLDLGSRQAVTADVDDIIDTASDPVESFVITTSTVASKLHSGQ